MSVRGDDLMKMGIKGEPLGKALNSLFSHAIQHKTNDKEHLLHFLTKTPEEHESNYHWSASEIDVLKKHYGYGNMKELLPKRTPYAIDSQAKRIGIK